MRCDTLAQRAIGRADGAIGYRLKAIGDGRWGDEAMRREAILFNQQLKQLIPTTSARNNTTSGREMASQIKV